MAPLPCSYVSGLQPMLQELENSKDTPPSAIKTFEMLREALQRSLDLISQCCDMGWMKALVKACGLQAPAPKIHTPAFVMTH